MSSNALAYLEDYLDTFEALPLEVTKQLSLLKELDSKCFQSVKSSKKSTFEFLKNINSFKGEEKQREMLKLTESYKKLIQDGQEKVKLATQTYDIVEKHIRRLDEDLLRFEEEQMTGPKLVSSEPKIYHREERAPTSSVTVANRPRRGANNTGEGTPKKRKGEDIIEDSEPAQIPYRPARTAISVPASAIPIQVPVPVHAVPAVQAAAAVGTLPRKVNAPRTAAPAIESSIPISALIAPENNNPEKIDNQTQMAVDGGSDGVIVETDVDPNEPTYCICDKPSFGEMIACDNDECIKEWFHYECVGLLGPVKGKWFCPDCTNSMK